jgi:hypothetical protein
MKDKCPRCGEKTNYWINQCPLIQKDICMDHCTQCEYFERTMTWKCLYNNIIYKEKKEKSPPVHTQRAVQAVTNFKRNMEETKKRISDKRKSNTAH